MGHFCNLVYILLFGRAELFCPQSGVTKEGEKHGLCFSPFIVYGPFRVLFLPKTLSLSLSPAPPAALPYAAP
jgi:hypothetical protein